MCFKCGIYDHRLDQCGQAGADISQSASENVKTLEAMHTQANQMPKEKYGSRMLVTRRERRRQYRERNKNDPGVPRGKRQNSSINKVSTSDVVGTHQSQFAMLEGLEDDGME